MKKADASSPTVAQESVVITAAIEYHYRRYVTKMETPGEYLQNDTDENVIILLKGILTDIMATVNPKLYRKYIITNKKGEALLYVKIQKALYGLLWGAILSYLKLVKDLEDFWLENSPYYP